MAENRTDNRHRRDAYVARINRVVDYIEAHIDRDLSLQTLARVANFSPCHFHRVFGAMMGETLSHFIQRLRVERAANMLLLNPKRSITGIALDCGFSGSAPFARVFRETFGMSASEWRRGTQRLDRKMSEADRRLGQTDSKDRKDFAVAVEYSYGTQLMQRWRIAMNAESPLTAEVTVKEIPEFHVAYIRHVGPYAGDAALFKQLFDKLFTWAGPRGLLRFPETKLLSVYHDNPEITDETKLRLDVCISVPENTEVDGEVGKMAIPAGRYAAAHFEIAPDQYGDAWNAVFGGWLPESGYQPADSPSFELYLNNPEEHPEGKHIFDICVPVKPL
jgi:AraC family transcriptional regulator